MLYLLLVLTAFMAADVFCQDAAPHSAAAASPICFYASQKGGQTIDHDESGGSPFASAFIELMAREKLTFDEFRRELVDLTKLRSNELQRPDVPTCLRLNGWQFLPKPSAEKRVAMLLAYSDYSDSAGMDSLPGAKHDISRLSVALDRAGFEVRSFLDPGRAELEMALKEFADLSRSSKVAMIYATGHGAEIGAATYLLPGNYPFSESDQSTMLREHAVPIAVLVAALQASHANLLFYGACRDNPSNTKR